MMYIHIQLMMHLRFRVDASRTASVAELLLASTEAAYIYIGGSGGASPVYPTPRNREIGFVSSSFSFRAVRAVRAGEAKLCGRMWDVVLIAGPPGC